MLAFLIVILFCLDIFINCYKFYRLFGYNQIRYFIKQNLLPFFQEIHPRTFSDKRHRCKDNTTKRKRDKSDKDTCRRVK